MKCPMLTMYAVTRKKPDEYTDRDCLKEECAWWCKKHGNCVILAYEAACDKLAETLKQINSKIPLGGAK